MVQSTAERRSPCWVTVAGPVGLPTGGHEPAGVREPPFDARGVDAGDGLARLRDGVDSTTDERAPELLGRLLDLPGVRAGLVHDADLAALAIEHGLILCSTDGDFARFPGLRWQNPIAA